MPERSGRVTLVGAGPGDPGLITLHGVEALRQADAVVYDYLASPELLAHAPEQAELIYVGKQAGRHTLAQSEINALLVRLAREGKRVVRLKGGDPFVFGRGGEEAEALVAAGVPFDVVPGVTSAIAAPAYAGIPVTHRGVASSLAIVTGHEDPQKATSAIDWGSLAGIDTLVFLMGVANLPAIAAELIAHGRRSDTPAAVIQWGTVGRQRTVTGTLADIATRVEEAGLGSPAVTVVGAVVGLRERLRWFDRRPLLGLRVLVTRTREQAGRLAEGLRALGAEPVECAVIETAPPLDWAPLDRAIGELGAYRWIAFTSANGVEAFFARLALAGRDARALAGARLAPSAPPRPRRSPPVACAPMWCRPSSWPRPWPMRWATCGGRGCCWRGPTSPAPPSPSGCGPPAPWSTRWWPTAPCARRGSRRACARRWPGPMWSPSPVPRRCGTCSRRLDPARRPRPCAAWPWPASAR